jgi:hypothetical protein
MERPTIEEIHEVMRESGMKIFETPFDVTMGGIRTKDNASNKFNDWIFASFYTDRGGMMSVVIEGTTDAGLYYRENPMNVDGTAIIQHGVQHRGAYTYMLKGGHRGQEAFRQTGKMKYWRDANRDQYLDFDGEEKEAIYATNGHDMGKVGENIGKWSAGCWGAEEENMDLLYIIANIQIKHGLGDKFSFALLHENQF